MDAEVGSADETITDSVLARAAASRNGTQTRLRIQINPNLVPAAVQCRIHLHSSPVMNGSRSRSAAKRAFLAEYEREPKRPKDDGRATSSELAASTFRISVVTMAGAVIVVEDASAADTIQSVKRRVFALNHKLRVRRQRLVYSAGPHGIDALADDQTLGGAGVPQDGSAKLDVLLVDLTEAEMIELGMKFLEAAKNGCKADMLELLDEGANLEFKNDYNQTALVIAAAGGHVECVRLLAESGVDLDAKGNEGWTALLWPLKSDESTVCVCFWRRGLTIIPRPMMDALR
jgi:hypothetical protein